MDQIKIQQLENEYKEYIDNHRRNVQKSLDTMKSNNECMDLIIKYTLINREILINIIDDIIKSHDLSKYKEEEFDAYRKNFYPLNDEEKELNKLAFDKAWKHHYENNLHHWDYWHECGIPDNMSPIFVVEMVCDWEAMGYKFGNTSKQWYEKNKNNIHLGEKQRMFAEEIMNIICK